MPHKEVQVPRLNSNDDFVDIVFLKPISSFVRAGEVIAVLETTKATFEVEAFKSGYFYTDCTEGQEVQVGSILCYISDEVASPPVKSPIQGISQGASQGASLSESHYSQCKAKEDEGPIAGSGGAEPGDLTSAKELSSVLKRIQELATGPNNIAKICEIHPSAQISPSARISCDTVSIGKHCIIGDNVIISVPHLNLGNYSRIERDVCVDSAGYPSTDAGLYVGEKSLISAYSYVNCCRQVVLGDNTAVSPRCSIFTHMFWNSIYEGYPSRFADVRLGNHVWIGPHTVILPNIRIADFVMVGPNSTVDSSIRSSNVFVSHGETHPIQRPNESSIDTINRSIIKDYMDHLEHVFGNGDANLNIRTQDIRSGYSQELSISYPSHSGSVLVLFCDPLYTGSLPINNDHSVTLDCRSCKITTTKDTLSDIVLELYHSIRRSAGVRLGY